MGYRRVGRLVRREGDIAACHALGLFDTHDWSSLNLVILSGSACPSDLVRGLAAKLPRGKVTQLWGMTETQAALYTRPQDPPEVAERSAGRATELTLEEVSAFLLERQIAKIKLPERLVIVPEMPLTPTRKIIKGQLKIPD